MNYLIILLGPSGAGKTTLEKKLVSLYPNLFKRSVSATTRDPRDGEINGQDYHFVSHEKFKEITMIESNQFDSNFYGMPLSELSGKKHIVLTTEPQGAFNVLKYTKENKIKIKPIVVYFDIDMSTRLNNMSDRGDAEDKIKKRINNDNVEALFQQLEIKPDLIIKELKDDLEKVVLNFLKVKSCK